MSGANSYVDDLVKKDKKKYILKSTLPIKAQALDI